MNNRKKILNLLGLAQRSGHIIDGEKRVLKAIQNQQSVLMFLATDVGENMRKKLYDKCKHYKIECITLYDTDTLSKAIGKVNRKVIAVTEHSFREPLKQLIELHRKDDFDGKSE